MSMNIMMDGNSSVGDDSSTTCHKNDNSTIRTAMSTIASTALSVFPNGSSTITTTAAVAATNNNNHNSVTPLRADNDRAVHRISMSALRHNYGCVDAAAGQQRCSVITVVKADGYGHGAIETALHLADYCGANAFAVATLEEGIALRQAFSKCPPGINPNQVAAHLNHNNTTTPTLITTTPTFITTTPVAQLFHNNANSNSAAHSPPSSSNSSCISGRSSQSSSPCEQCTTATATATATATTTTTTTTTTIPNRIKTKHALDMNQLKPMRPTQIRILVLGPPVGYPRCFDLYHHFQIELMVSGPEVARALLDWVANGAERKRMEVEKVATDLKEKVMHAGFLESNPPSTTVTTSTTTANAADNSNLQPPKKAPPISATLSNVSGFELAKEVRAILQKQQKAAVAAAVQQQQSTEKAVAALTSTSTTISTSTTTLSNNNNDSSSSSNDNNTSDASVRSTTSHEQKVTTKKALPSNLAKTNMTSTPQPFRGIHDAAKDSRSRALAAEKARKRTTGEDEDEDDNIVTVIENGGVIVEEANSTSQTTVQNNTTNNNNNDTVHNVIIVQARKRLRWHALVDSGMGRLGFKSVDDDNDNDHDQANGSIIHDEKETRTTGASSHMNGKKKWKEGPNRDVVTIMKLLYDAEIDGGAPIEFFGMCTHMAEANSASTYTLAQMARFKGLLKRVRQAGINISTISTDNSSALLTTNLTHFDSVELLSQPDADTRGFVRTGGAIYGQRPAFPQLKAISTLIASVRHVAVVKKGESVGYDRAYIAEKDVRIATLAIGFADGYPRELGKTIGKVSIRGEVFPVVGNVCMDMLMVEIGSADENERGVSSLVVVGDVAILWGPDDVLSDDQEQDEHFKNSNDGLVRLQDFAEKLNTTLSALTCGLNKNRVRREYVT